MRGKKRITVAEALVLLGILLAFLLPALDRAERRARAEAAASAAEDAGDMAEETGEAEALPREAPTIAERIKVAGFIVMGIIVLSFFGKQLLRQRRR